MPKEQKTVTLDELKESVNEVMTTFSAFKDANDERLAQIEEKGVADPVTVERMKKIDKSLDAFEDLNQRFTLQVAGEKARQEQMDRVETALERIGKAANKENLKGEKKEAFDAFLRKGDNNLTPEQVKVLTIADDTSGGYLAPSEYVAEIIKDIIEFSPMRSLARVRQTSQRSTMIPKRTGTFAASWVAELGTRSEATGLTYGLEEVPNHELSALVDISMLDLEDSSFNLESELNMEFAEQFAVAEGTAFISGNSVGKPEGFLENSDVSETNTGDANLITADGLIETSFALKDGYAKVATWIMRRTTLSAVRQLKDGQGSYLLIPGIANAMPNQILGSPYVEMVDMPAISAGTKPIAFGDFRRGYTIIDRIQIALLRDPFTQAATGTIRFIARKRVGGQVTLAEAIRINTVSA